MFADKDELYGFAGLEISDAAIIRVYQATECAYCHTPPAPRGVNNPHKVAAWIDTYARRLGSWSEGPLATGGGATVPRIELSDDESQCLVCDSQLDAALGIPDHILAPLATNRFSERQREFLESELVFAICGVCRYSEHARAENAAKILDRYVAVRFLGDRNAFEAAEYAAEAHEIAGLIAREVEQQRQERRVTGL